MGETDYNLAFNRGVVDSTALARGDIKRVALSAEIQQNLMPLTMGPMQFRPGWGYLLSTKDNNASRSIPFLFSIADTAQIEFTNTVMRVLIDNVAVTRAAVDTVFLNGGFDSDLSDWTDRDQGAATSTWVATSQVWLAGDGASPARIEQALTVSGGDQNVEHAIEVVVAQGPIQLKIGTAQDLSDLMAEVSLGTGIHSLTFTPTGASAYVLISNTSTNVVDLTSVAIAASGDMELVTTLETADLSNVRYTQSGDVIFMACGLTHRPLKVERRSTRSWSLVNYEPSNGPMRAPNGTAITLTPTTLSGGVLINTSVPYFTTTDIGTLIKQESLGQSVVSDLTAQNTFTDPIRTSGITSGRIFDIEIVDVPFEGTVTLQRSVGAIGAWTDVKTWTEGTEETYDDTFDNQIIFYRLGIKTGDYTSGTARCFLTYGSGSITGYARIYEITSSSSVSAYVTQSFGNTVASVSWSEGSWSTKRGFPTSVGFFGGRLVWAGKDKIIASVVDDFNNHDEDFIGDAGPLNRSIGTGPVDNINWLAPLQQLVAGAEGAEFLLRSSALEEPLTPSNFNLREATTFGSSNVGAVKIDASAVFVDRTGSRVMETVTDAATMETGELTVLSREICRPQIIRIAVQRRPETMIHLVRSDGVVVVLVFDRAEEVRAFITVVTDGLIEDVCIFPAQVGTPDDKVVYTVQRTINSVTKRYHEQWSLYSEAQGGATTNKMLDSHIIYSGASTTAMTGLDHLEGEDVWVWANGIVEGPHTVTSGAITLDTATTDAIIGLTYSAIFKSTKVGFATIGPQSLGWERRITHMGFVLLNSHVDGLKYGTEADFLDDLPAILSGETSVRDYWDEIGLSADGAYTTDPRIYLTCEAPYPLTVSSVIVAIEDGRKR